MDVARYEYLGYLSILLEKYDPAAAMVKAVEFSGAELKEWKSTDLDAAVEWRGIPAKRTTTEHGVHLEGDFRHVTRIDSLSENDPRYWVPFSTIDVEEPKLPIDTSRCPIVEVTYRCTSDRAHPTWMWTYEGGSHFGALPKSREWITVARTTQHFGFPTHIDNVVIRLYSPTRTLESMEIASVRFRAMTRLEKDAYKKGNAVLAERKQRSPNYKELATFLPLGVYMDAVSAKRLAKMLGVSDAEYWGLALQDLVNSHHNAIALANSDHLDDAEWRDLQKLADGYQIRIVTRHDFPLGGPKEAQDQVIEKHIRPYADSKTIFARMLGGEPIEQNLHEVLDAKERIEEADPNHPVAIIARYPNAYPLFAPFYNASGIGYFTSRRPWDMGKAVRAHLNLGSAKQFWVAAPAFVYPTETPEWSTCPEMRLMVNLSFANGARGWFAYSYHNDPVWVRGRVQRTLTGPFLTFSDLWLELMQRMKLVNAIAPLLLEAKPEDEVEEWFKTNVTSEKELEVRPGIPRLGRYHLRGPDFSLYITVSNDVREMQGVNFDIPADATSGCQFFDVTHYVVSREWTPMGRRAHYEMFPGQARIILVAAPAVCEKWRDVIAARLTDSDILKMQHNMNLARAYSIDISHVERRIARANNLPPHEELLEVHAARDELLNLVYEEPRIVESRTKVIEASSAVCACDGALCRLVGQGKRHRARQLGGQVVPLAREFTKLRLEMRRGNGGKILEACSKLSLRSLEMLAQIRAETDASA